MKTQEYVKKYNLSTPYHRFNHEEFAADFTIDFLSLVEYMEINGEFNVDKFNTCVNQIRIL